VDRKRDCLAPAVVAERQCACRHWSSRRSPHTLIESLLALGRSAVSLDVGGGGKVASATVTLYITRTLARFDSYLSLLLTVSHDAPAHLDPNSTRELDLSAELVSTLSHARKQLRSLLWGELASLLSGWIVFLGNKVDESGDHALVEDHTRRICNIHAHLLLSMRNAALDINEERAKLIVNAMIFLNQ
jgi:hypothetical protein